MKDNSMTAGYLVDATALYPLLLKLGSNIVDYADKLAVLDITVYEIGNIILREHKKGRITDLNSIKELFNILIAGMRIVRPTIDLAEILGISLEHDIPFYDAAHIYTANIYNMKLVTENNKLLERENVINVDTLIEELRGEHQDKPQENPEEQATPSSPS